MSDRLREREKGGGGAERGEGEEKAGGAGPGAPEATRAVLMAGERAVRHAEGRERRRDRRSRRGPHLAALARPSKAPPATRPGPTPTGPSPGRTLLLQRDVRGTRRRSARHDRGCAGAGQPLPRPRLLPVAPPAGGGLPVMRLRSSAPAVRD